MQVLANDAPVAPASTATPGKVRLSTNTVIAPALTAIAYGIGAHLGMALTFGREQFAVLWPPNAILLAALLICPVRMWWLLVCAVLPVHLLVEVGSGVSMPMALSWFASNSFEALLGATIVRRFSAGRVRLDTVRAFSTFLIGATLVTVSVATFLDGALIAWNGWGGGTFWSNWQTRFLSNALAMQIIVPAVLAVNARTLRAVRRARPQRLAEGGLLALCILAVGIVTFVYPERAFGLGPALLYVPLPLLLWAAMRFGTAGVSLSLLVVTFLTVAGAVKGAGPFLSFLPRQNALSVELFLLLISVPLSLLAIVITERRRSEGRGRETHRLLTLTMQTAHTGTWQVNLETGEIRTDGLMREIFGLPASGPTTYAQWIGSIHPDDRAWAESHYQAALSADSPRDARGNTPIPEFEARVRHPDGSVRWFMTRGTVLRHADGSPYATTGVAVDTTERHRTARALWDNDDRMALAATTANIGFWSIEVATNELWLSEHCNTMLGLPADPHLAREAFDAIIHPLDVGAHISDVSGQHSEPIVAREFHVVRADNTRRLLASSARRELGPDNRPERIIGVLRDVTELRNAEQTVEERSQELAHLSRIATIGELSATLVHEIGQPAGAVLLNAYAADAMLRHQAWDPATVQQVIGDVLRDSRRLTTIIDQLRSLLRRDEVARELLDMRRVVSDAIELAHVELARQGIRLELAMPDELPGVMGNRAQLLQVLLNLILNARDAMTDAPQSRRQLRVTAEVDVSAMLTITVEDSGVGIPADRMPHIFTPFFTSKERGLGLGLGISRSIVTEHHGTLSAESRAEGAAFHITLPAVNAPVAGADDLGR
jgi:PAS domain S-box-containing protein